jgi:DNA-directed RNA polymerase II subunit RPB2
MGIYISNYRDRLDISYVLYHPQKPIVTTRTSKYIFTDVLTSGENAVVAIATYAGYNQEDSLVFNLSAIDRGMFRSTSVKKYISAIQKNQSTSQDDIFMKPDPTKVTGIKHGSYDKLNDRGFVPEETTIVNGDIIIGKVSPIQPIGNSNKIFKDSSEVYRSHAPGKIDRVYTNIYNNEGYEMRKVRVRSERIPQTGDKFCSRHGQKGTVGIRMKASNMPYTREGISPDIILNPNAIPSRMTVGQLIECLVGKVAAIEGIEADGTPFNEPDTETIKDTLEKLGYNREGTEYLYNGMTGKRFKVQIYIGPTYYQRLKHLVEDKIHSRSRGPRTLLTRQPPEGRSRDGGLRLGEMERDAIGAHGMSKFLKEKLMDTSDAYTTYVCDLCGLFAQRMYRKENQSYTTNKDIYFCPACKNYTQISKIMIPYAFKLLIQELMSMNIAPRIITERDIYTA